MEDKTACRWAIYKGLWHMECCSFLTTTMYGELNYTNEEIPENHTCPECGKEIMIVERQFGRKAKGGSDEK